MTIPATCAACGQDCTDANVTYRGEVYHYSCVPLPPKRSLVDDSLAKLQSTHDRVNLRRAAESRKPYKDNNDE